MNFSTQIAILALIGCSLLATFHARADDAKLGTQQERQLRATADVQLQYLLFLPAGYEDQPQWPLILFLHGAGERGSDLELVKKHGPPKIVENKRDFPFIVVSPQCPRDRRWEPVSLVALLDDVCANYHVDPQRIYLTGLSMGGFGTWALASHAPERFAAIAPICGGGERFWAGRIANLPTWVFHGAKDTAVPLERSEVMVEALRARGGEPKFTVYPEAGHDSWTASYDNPDLYQWLLAHKRQSPAPEGTP